MRVALLSSLPICLAFRKQILAMGSASVDILMPEGSDVQKSLVTHQLEKADRDAIFCYQKLVNFMEVSNGVDLRLQGFSTYPFTKEKRQSEIQHRKYEMILSIDQERCPIFKLLGLNKNSLQPTDGPLLKIGRICFVNDVAQQIRQGASATSSWSNLKNILANEPHAVVQDKRLFQPGKRNPTIANGSISQF